MSPNNIILISSGKRLNKLKEVEHTLVKHFRASPTGSWKAKFCLEKTIAVQEEIRAIESIQPIF